jgi:hypothetical protein
LNLKYRARELAAKAGIFGLKASGFYDGYWNHWRGAMFDHAEAKGLHILPVHYYSPIPQAGSKARRSELPINVECGRAKLEAMLSKYSPELEALFKSSRYDPTNAAFGPLDAATLYCMLRETKPNRIIEIGSGHSTIVASEAIKASDYGPEFICIEPYLPDYLRDTPKVVTRVVETPLQQVPLEWFTCLDEGDLLFIDSTHVVSFGSDVLYLYLTIVPALAKGVRIHIHDIFLPNDYPARWLKESRFFWNEQYLLEALLLMNPSFKVELPVNAVAQTMELPDFPPSDVDPASFWMVRVE